MRRKKKDIWYSLKTRENCYRSWEQHHKISGNDGWLDLYQKLIRNKLLTTIYNTLLNLDPIPNHSHLVLLIAHTFTTAKQTVQNDKSNECIKFLK